MARTPTHTEDDFKREIHRVTAALGHTPTSREFSKLATIPLSTLIYKFESYSKAIAFADGVVNEVKIYSDVEIMAHFKQMAKELGRPPLCNEYRENGLVCIQTIFRRKAFGSYSGLRSKCGFAAEGDGRKAVTDEGLLADLERVIHELGHIPTVNEYKNNGIYRYGNFSKSFGGLKWAVTELAQKGRLPEGLKIGRTAYKSEATA